MEWIVLAACAVAVAFGALVILAASEDNSLGLDADTSWFEDRE